MTTTPKDETIQSRRRNAVPPELANGKTVAAANAGRLLEALLRPGDRVVLEGNNQKQARFLSRTLAGLPVERIQGLHMLMSSVSMDEHLDLFRKGLANRLDFAFSGPQAVPLYTLVREGRIQVGAIHTYLELYSRYFTDRVPHVALVCAEQADRDGNLYCGANTEETPVICEATHGGQGVVVAQVERLVDSVPRVDVPGDQVDFVVPTGVPEPIEALFTRDPAKMTDAHVLMGMMVIRGIYEEYGVQCLNHGIGYATAAVELLLPTYARERGLQGKICSHWALNPHPTLIPAIEAGFVKTIHSFGSEPGMKDYIADRADVFFTDPRGRLRSNRLLCHMIGYYDAECFVGATLQIDRDGNSSTATHGRISGFGGAPNLGSHAGGRRHATPAWRQAGKEAQADGDGLPRGRKLIVQVTPTVSEKKQIPVFVESLDAVEMARDGLFELPPVMIYGDDVTHIVTEQGIAYLLRCRGRDERRAAIRAVAGDTPVGRQASPAETERLRREHKVRTPEQLGIDPATATRDRLAARNLNDLARLSRGLYHPPAGCRG